MAERFIGLSLIGLAVLELFAVWNPHSDTVKIGVTVVFVFMFVMGNAWVNNSFRRPE